MKLGRANTGAAATSAKSTIPNATVMIINNAESFGLSQLHQLRGRIGRGSHKSYCILMTDARN